MNKNRVKIIDTENSISISINSYKSLWYIIIFSALLTGTLILIVNILYDFFTSYPEQKLNYFLICSVLFVALSYFTHAILWILIGYELVEIDAGHLVVRRKIMKYSIFKRSFDIKELNNFRIFQPEQFDPYAVYPYGTYSNRAAIGLIKATLRFNDDKRYHEFGYQLNVADTQYIYNGIVAFCRNKNIMIT